MRHSPIQVLLALTLLTLNVACSEDDGYKRPKVWPKPTEPEPASPIYHDLKQELPSEEQIAAEAEEHNALLEAEVERALEGKDQLRRETVFTHLLPELLQLEPGRLVSLHERLKAGEPRDTLGVEMARYWINADAPGATRWLKSLEGDERREATIAAIQSIAFWDPRTALSLIEDFGLERENSLRTVISALKETRRDPPD